jgi:hypothetical protein
LLPEKSPTSGERISKGVCSVSIVKYISSATDISSLDQKIVLSANISEYINKNIKDATAITIFFCQQEEKSLGLLRIKLQKLTFCRNAISEIS